MKQIIYLVPLLLFSSCFQGSSLDGIWNFELDIQNNKIPFYLKFEDKKVILKNNVELIELEYKKEGNKIIIPILNYDAAFELEELGNTLKGHWIKYNRKTEYKLSLFGMKTKFQKFPIVDEVAFSGDTNLKITFEDNSYGILTHSGNNTYSSIVTETGDYRYLTSKHEGEALILYGFDGLFAFYLHSGYRSDGIYEGTMHAGLSYNQKFITKNDPKFSLRDPYKITTYKGNLLEISLPNLKNEQVKIINKGTPAVIQIFGSWCPNCIDETKYFLEWKKKNPNKKIDFKIVSFERSPNKKHALKMLKKTQSIYKINYPVLIGGYTKENKVSDVFKDIKNFISFPTSIYVDKSGNVKEIHAGFNGPATGEYYENFKIHFKKLIDSLLNE